MPLDFFLIHDTFTIPVITKARMELSNLNFRTGAFNCLYWERIYRREILRADAPAGMDTLGHPGRQSSLFLPKIFPVLSLIGHKGSVNFPSNQQTGGYKKKLVASPSRKQKIPSTAHRSEWPTRDHRRHRGEKGPAPC